MRLLEALLSAALSVTATTAGPTPVPSPSPPAAIHGAWPVRPPTVVRGFEPPSEAWAAGHRGVDLAGSIGMPVLSGLGGTVTFSGLVAGRGVIVISHGDTRTTYEPVIAEVARGDVVVAGERIGALDITQSHCFPAVCLHWGWIRGREYLDPLQLVGSARKVRLLPFTHVGAPADTPS